MDGLSTAVIGFLLGGREPDVCSVMGLGTAQRDVSAAIVVTAQNFASGKTLAFVLVAALVMLLVLLPTAKRMGPCVSAPETAPVQAPTEAGTVNQ